MNHTLEIFLIGWGVLFGSIQLGMLFARIIRRQRASHHAAIQSQVNQYMAHAHGWAGMHLPNVAQYYPPKRNGHPLTPIFKSDYKVGSLFIDREYPRRKKKAKSS